MAITRQENLVEEEENSWNNIRKKRKCEGGESRVETYFGLSSQNGKGRKKKSFFISLNKRKNKLLFLSQKLLKIQTALKNKKNK